MTTSNHDDQIEVLSIHPPHEAQYIYLDTPSGVEDNIRVLPPGRDPPTPPQTEKQKRVARIVAVIATLMILTSFLLVAVTLSMSDHIDEMVSSTTATSSHLSTLRKMNGFTTTPRTPRLTSTTPSPTPALQINMTNS